MDIIGRGRDTGLLASDEAEYCDAMAELLLQPNSAERRSAMAAAARESVKSRFSENAFSEAFCAQLGAVLP